MNRELKVLDGGMGGELIARGIMPSSGLWSARALLDSPDAVMEVHSDYIKAGAEVITTNSYSTIPSYLAKAGMSERYEDLTDVAAKMARTAADAASSKVEVAGCLPPLSESYRHDLVPPDAEGFEVYKNLVTVLQPSVDLYLCETMSSAREAATAAKAARAVDAEKPVWIAWTLDETPGGGLRSGESIAQAMAAVALYSPDAYLFNCTAPEAISVAIEQIVKLTDRPVGAYPNRYHIPPGWTLDNEVGTKHIEMTVDEFMQYVDRWRAMGASVLGGCCGIGPSFIAAIAASR
ncbi:MAG: homocysteine S-methyltransferase family protein [Gammaproteobacteria bacterium]|jgi:homocysteine S-methyltransferase|nr:homocysteine S-methyltransferase family protein [Gammaproteobacteria bacterium]